MATVSCPSCFALVRSPGNVKFRGFLNCPSCGHRFLASIEDTSPAGPSGTTQAMSPNEIAAALGAAAEPEEEDFTRESTRREEVPLPAKGSAHLRIIGGTEVLPLDRFQFVIGREGADLSLDDPAISRRHAVIENHSSRYLLKDMGSTNGTFLNGRRVSVEFLDHGDVVQVGRTRVRFEVARRS